MKKRIFAMAVACVLALSFALVGCGGGSSSNSPVGTWEISGMESGGEVYSAEDLQAMKDYGMNVVLYIYEDGTASMNVFGEEMTGGTWDETSLTFEGQPIDMSVSGNTLTLSQGSEVMTFTRVDSASAASSSAAASGAAAAASSSSSGSSSGNSSSNTSNTAVNSGATAPAETTPQPEPQPQPGNGEILSGSEGYDSTITVIAPANESAYVKLKDSAGNTVLSFYVRAGDTATVGVPGGQYYAYFAMGTDWYGVDELFGANTSYSYDEEISDFSQYTVEYTLQSVSDGNLSLEPIPESSF